VQPRSRPKSVFLERYQRGSVDRHAPRGGLKYRVQRSHTFGDDAERIEKFGRDRGRRGGRGRRIVCVGRIFAHGRHLMSVTRRSGAYWT
jgi:hypothetical protein